MIFNKNNNNNIVEYANSLIKLENEKENNLIKNSNTMIIYNSIILITLVNIMFELYNRLESVRTLIVIFSLILIGITLLSILFSILSEHIFNKEKDYSLKELINKDSYIDVLEEVYDYKNKSNRKRRNLLLVSHILNYSFYGLILIFGMVIMIVL